MGQSAITRILRLPRHSVRFHSVRHATPWKILWNNRRVKNPRTLSQWLVKTKWPYDRVAVQTDWKKCRKNRKPFNEDLSRLVLFNSVLLLYSPSCEKGEKGNKGAKSDLEYTIKNNPITRIMTDRKHIATTAESIGDYNRARMKRSL